MKIWVLQPKPSPEADEAGRERVELLIQNKVEVVFKSASNFAVNSIDYMRFVDNQPSADGSQTSGEMAFVSSLYIYVYVYVFTGICAGFWKTKYIINAFIGITIRG